MQLIVNLMTKGCRVGGYQEILISMMCDVTTNNYQEARLHRLKHEVVDDNCQSHDLYESHM